MTSSVFSATDHAGHLLRRATFGARPSDVAELKKLGINAWLTKQLKPTSFKDPEGDLAYRSFALAGASVPTILSKVKDYGWDSMLHTTHAVLGKQIFSNRQLFEIVADIFANHLHVPLPGEQWATSPGYLASVIRANTLGKYSTMLLKAMKHPAMLNYLNNDESTGSNVNENLGRELLELHTVGIASGYTEVDVKNSAKILSGRSWQYNLWSKRSTYGPYAYNAKDHYVGPVTVLGFSHANSTAIGGEAVGDAYLLYLARHPDTARTIARKIAVRFVSDQPSDNLIARLAAVYTASDTSILAVVRAVFLSSDFWSARGTRMRRPLEDAVGAARVLNIGRGTRVTTGIKNLHWRLHEAGHTPHGWLPPNGYPDVAGAWLGAGAMIQRWSLHRALVYGWGKDFSYAKTTLLVPRSATTTNAYWTQSLAKRLLGTPLSAEHLAAVLAGAKLSPNALVSKDEWQCGKLASLILDSPYFQLR
jgi:uncharacterized protein (DUF1800 family)